MNRLLLTVLVSIGLVVVDGAWEANRVYKYNVRVYSGNNEGSAIVSINAQSDNLLIGQIHESLIEPARQFFNLPWNKQFLIHLENGVIESISVNGTMPNDQINQLKAIVSQFQVDVRAHQNNRNAIHKTMEPTYTGNCETHYAFSELSPKYSAEAVPSQVLGGEFIKIEKTINFNNCKERSDSQSQSSYVTRVILSGDAQNYVIQSSKTTNGAEGSGDYLEVTLESVTEGSIRPMRQIDSFVNVGSLVYTKNTENTTTQNSLGAAKCPKAENAPEQWSGCWTAFLAADSICKNDFSPEWEDIKSECCGFLCLGKHAKCRKSYPGCVSTVCYSVFVPNESLCKDQYKDDYPARCGGFVDCSPGFWGARCCPKSYL